eukprot:1254954-Rhodomonas_salina.2
MQQEAPGLAENRWHSGRGRSMSSRDTQSASSHAGPEISFKTHHSSSLYTPLSSAELLRRVHGTSSSAKGSMKPLGRDTGAKSSLHADV